MTIASALALFGALILFSSIPGPGVFAVLARSLSLGVKHGMMVSLGVITGDLVFIAFCVFGLAALAENVSWLFLLVKYVGAAYLLYLAISIWRTKVDDQTIEAVKRSSYVMDYSVGLVTTLSNPKTILFYIGFLPAFLDFKAISSADILALVILVILTVGGVLLGYAMLAARTRTLITKPNARRALNKVAASIMGITGVWMLSRSSI